MAQKIVGMLQRGMHFRRVAYTTIRKIMGAGAQGVEVTISGKIRGSRSACAKFADGYIKKCGEPSIKHVREGFATVQLKPGVLGIYVRIMPPEITLPDKIEVKEREASDDEEITPLTETTKPEVTEEIVEEIEEEDVLEKITEEPIEEELTDVTEDSEETSNNSEDKTE